MEPVSCARAPGRVPKLDLTLCVNPRVTKERLIFDKEKGRFLVETGLLPEGAVTKGSTRKPGTWKAH